MKELQRHVLTGASITPDHECIVFHAGSDIIYQTRGDCCNLVWFEAVTGAQFLRGEVLEVTEDEWREFEHPIHDAAEEAGFWSIKTPHGTCRIEVRNAHNGYYGGEVTLVPKALHPTKPLTDFTGGFDARQEK